MKFHSPPILRVQSCLTDAVIVILSDYCFTDTHLTLRGPVFYSTTKITLSWVQKDVSYSSSTVCAFSGASKHT